VQNKITLLPGWAAWTGFITSGCAHRKVFEQITPNRQLLGYLVYLPSADSTIFTLRVDEDGELLAAVTSFHAGGLCNESLRFAYAESCYRGFKSQFEPEAVTLAVVA